LNITQDLLILPNLSIPIRILKGSGKKLQMSFRDNRLVVETYNGSLGDYEIQFMRNNLKWIVVHYEQQKKSWEDKITFLSRADTHTRILGKETEVVFEYDSRYHYHLKEGKLFIYTPHKEPVNRKALIATVIRKIAEVYLNRSLKYWADIAGLQYNKLCVKNHISKWGSCSVLRNINLNWHLVMLDKSLSDYVIIHELMHLHEMNHAPAFWKRVHQYYPEHKTARVSLKRQQWLIGIYS